MNIKRRKEAVKRLNECYELRHVGFTCYYCGDSATSIDHVPPISFVWMYGTEEVAKQKLEMIKVPACLECNSKILRDEHINTLAERVIYVYEKLQLRHKKVLSMPEWYEDEIEELGHTLKSVISDSATVKAWVERRLQYIELVHEI